VLRNFIITSDLQKYDTSILKYLPTGQADWSTQIAEAFELVKDKIRARDIVVRNLGIPLDLNRAVTDTTKQDALKSLNKIATYNGTHIDGVDGFRRFVVDVTAITGSSGYVFNLQGSNDQTVNATTEPVNWKTIATLTPTMVKEYSIVFSDEYKYYRLNLVITAGTPSVTFTASIVETYQDRWIVWLALSLIYEMMAKTPDDVWMRKSNDAMIMFQNAFDTYKFILDSDDDNLVDDDDDVKHTTQIEMVR
jgi:hypothetical protein